MKDFYNSMGAEITINPAAYTATETGSGVDLQGFEGATVLIVVGAWTDGTHAFEVQESSDDSTYTAVSDDDLLGSEPTVDAADEDETVYRVGYVGTERYIRVVATLSSATSGAEFSAIVAKGFPRKSPVS